MPNQSEIQWAHLLKKQGEGPRFQNLSTDGEISIGISFYLGTVSMHQRLPAKLLQLDVTGVCFPTESRAKPKVVFTAYVGVLGSGTSVQTFSLPWPTTRAKLRKKKLTLCFVDMTDVYTPAFFSKKIGKKVSEYLQQFGTRATKKNALSQARPLRPTPEIKSEAVRRGSHAWNVAYNDTAQAYESYRRTYTSVRTPNFGSLKVRGQLPVNPHSVSLKRVVNGQAIRFAQGYTGGVPSASWANEWNLTTFFISALTPIPSDPAHRQVTLDKAITRLIAAAQSNISAYLAQDIAQFGQLTRLVGNTATRLLGSYMALKKRDFRSAVGFLLGGTSYGRIRRGSKTALVYQRSGRKLSASRTLAENWLELQYAWKPLLEDIHGSVQSISAYMQKDRSVRVVRGSANEVLTVANTYAGQFGGTIGRGETLTRHRARVGIRYKVDDHLKAFLAQTGFTNPLNLAWEILPFSFVVDWLLPIGPYLETLSSWDGLVLIDGYQTQFTRQTVSIEISGFDNSGAPPTYTQRKLYGNYSRDWVILNRSKLTSFPRLGPPTVKNPLSVSHALSALSLLRVAFKTPYH